MRWIRPAGWRGKPEPRTFAGKQASAYEVTYRPDLADDMPLKAVSRDYPGALLEAPAPATLGAMLSFLPMAVSGIAAAGLVVRLIAADRLRWLVPCA
jgi:hypothetical protein